MSIFGALHAFLRSAADEIETYGIDEMQAIVETGDLPKNHSSLDAPTHLFSWTGLRELLERHSCEIVIASAANFLSIGNDETCQRWLDEDPEMWDRFLAWEVKTCAQPGAIDGGTHIVAVVQKH
jgi:hypothetical protein